MRPPFLYLEHESHDQLYGWWMRRGVHHCTVVHVDMHHDLGNNFHSLTRTKPRHGNFLRFALARGYVGRIFWIVPFSQSLLLRGVIEELLLTLPVGLRRRVEKAGRGRWQVKCNGGIVEVRGYDDLPLITGSRKIEISFDLDFFYHPKFNGPTLLPVPWMRVFLKWVERMGPRAVFMAWSLRGGYAPPTYRPVVDWIRQALFNGNIPSWSVFMWKRIMSAELSRHGSKKTFFSANRPYSQIASRQEADFWMAWQAYLKKEWGRVKELQGILQGSFCFHPIEEVMTAYQAGAIPSPLIWERVCAALPQFCPVSKKERVVLRTTERLLRIIKSYYEV